MGGKKERKVGPFALFQIFLLFQGVQSELKQELKLVHIRDIQVENPGLLNFLLRNVNDKKELSLMSSSYSLTVNSRDIAYFVENVGEPNKTQVKPFQTTFLHPKDINQVPAKAFDFMAVSVPDGSPVAGKGNGKILLVDVTDLNFQKVYDLTSAKVPSRKFFHFGRVVWTDLGGVWKKQHFIVCRSTSGQEPLAQLVFYERPALGDELGRPWKEIVLKEGACDTNLAELHVKQNKENWEILYATGRVTGRLDFFWPETPKGGLGWWNDPSQVKGRVLDENREFFDVRVWDVNNDRSPDVLVTVLGSMSNKNGSLEIWEIDPTNFRNVEGYTRHVIEFGFSPKTTGSDARSPGAVNVFYPTSNRSVKPWIILSGADDGRVYYYVPRSEDPRDWNYEKREVPLGRVVSVGGVAVEDVDSDGFAEVFVSLHDSDTIRQFAFRPQDRTTTARVETTTRKTTHSGASTTHIAAPATRPDNTTISSVEITATSNHTTSRHSVTKENPF